MSIKNLVKKLFHKNTFIDNVNEKKEVRFEKSNQFECRIRCEYNNNWEDIAKAIKCIINSATHTMTGKDTISLTDEDLGVYEDLSLYSIIFELNNKDIQSRHDILYTLWSSISLSDNRLEDLEVSFEEYEETIVIRVTGREEAFKLIYNAALKVSNENAIDKIEPSVGLEGALYFFERFFDGGFGEGIVNTVNEVNTSSLISYDSSGSSLDLVILKIKSTTFSKLKQLTGYNDEVKVIGQYLINGIKSYHMVIVSMTHKFIIDNNEELISIIADNDFSLLTEDICNNKLYINKLINNEDEELDSSNTVDSDEEVEEAYAKSIEEMYKDIDELIE